MSVGQAIGGAVGAIAGFMLPGVGWAIGAQVGLMVGGYIDPPPGPHFEGPKLSDLTVQTSTYGAGKTRAYGTVAVTGNVFWLEGDKYVEHAHEQESGGKGGGGGATSTSYTYSATFAVALAEGQEITGIRRLWVSDRLIYDAGSDNVESIIASNQGGQTWKLYTGADDQEAEPRMQADKGAANVSAYPGRAYIVFYDLDLTEHYNNSLLAAQVKAEIVCSGAPDIQTEEVWNKWAGNTGTWGNRFPVTSIRITPAGVDYAVWQAYHWNGAPEYVNWGVIEFPYVDELQHQVTTSGVGWGYGYRNYFVSQSDADYVLTSQVEFNGFYKPWYRLISPSGIIDSSGRYINQDTWEAGGYSVFDRGDIYLFGTSGKLQQITIADGVILQTAAYTSPGWLAASENYLFAVTNAGSNVRKIYRADFSEVGNYAMPSAVNSLYVIDDTTFYAASDGTIRKYVNGALAATFTNVFSSGCTHQFAVFSEDPFYGVATRYSAGLDTWYWSIAHSVVANESASIRNVVTSECGAAGLAPSDLELSALINSPVRGYRVTGVSAPRSALEPLQAAWPFDVYQKGYKIGFKSRGGASVATIAESDLGAVSGNENTVLLPVSREMETQIARTVTVRHLDMDRDYEIGEQTAPERAGVSSVEPRQVELPIVLTADEAAQVADVLNAKGWTERVKFGPFSLPPTYAALEPADVVTINHRSRSWQARLTRIEYLPDGRLTCDAVLSASAAYDSSASGSNPVVVGQSMVPLSGSSRVVLLDIPRVDAAQDVPGIAAVMYGFTTGWPGGVLVRSDDNGNTWQSVAGFNAKANSFTATNYIGAGRTDIIDAASVLTVTPDHDAASIYSVTDLQLFAGANLAAYGADGRWEVIGIKTAVDNTGSYSLSNFMRGRYGTEWAMSLHAAADKLVLLDTVKAGFIGLPTSAINSPRLWRGVTQGSPVSSASDIELTYTGVNLKPLAPVYLNGSRHPITLDWSINWLRRSRSPSAAFSGLVTPLGEASESYEVEVWDSSYAALKRTITGLSSASASYTAAQQIADFGSEQSTLYLKIYQLSAVIGRGLPLVSSIYRFLPVEPYSDSVVLLLHHDDTGLTDVKGHAVTLNGTVSRSATQSVAGGYAASFDGATGYLSLADTDDWYYGTGPMTIEGFYRFNSAPGADQYLMGQRVDGNNYVHLYATSTTLVFDSYSSSVQRPKVTGTTTHDTTGWHYVAVVRDGTSLSLYAGGAPGSTATRIGTATIGAGDVIPNIAAALQFGRWPGGGHYFNGYQDEWRITKAARYSGATFTVPSVPFPNP